MGKAIQETKADILLGSVIVSCIFFANNMIVISKTTKIGMNKLLKKVNEEAKKIGMELSL